MVANSGKYPRRTFKKFATARARAAFANERSIQLALVATLSGRHPGIWETPIRIILTWLKGRSVRQVAEGLLVTPKRVSSVLKGFVAYVEAHAGTARSADELVRSALAVTIRPRGRQFVVVGEKRAEVIACLQQTRSVRLAAEKAKIPRSTLKDALRLDPALRRAFSSAAAPDHRPTETASPRALATGPNPPDRIDLQAAAATTHLAAFARTCSEEAQPPSLPGSLLEPEAHARSETNKGDEEESPEAISIQSDSAEGRLEPEDFAADQTGGSRSAAKAAIHKKLYQVPALTAKQRLALVYLSAYAERNGGLVPSRREISGALELSRPDPMIVLRPLA